MENKFSSQLYTCLYVYTYEVVETSMRIGAFTEDFEIDDGG